jgi:Mn2+/Fe2+ NRAMP family transporter
MVATQFISAKVGMVTGMGLAGVLRRYYAPGVLYPAVIGLVIAHTINAGADIGAIAAALNLGRSRRPSTCCFPFPSPR